jgi:riboflavin kinase/FMN adenylyltransferase
LPTSPAPPAGSFSQVDPVDRLRSRSLCCIGNFDGVHRGHVAVLNRAGEIARERGLSLRAMTFDPHPAVVLGRDPPPVLTPPARKVELMRRAVPGLEVVVRAFDRELASMTPEQFTDRVLVSELAVGAVVVGSDFRFGKGRAGDFATLVELGRSRGFEARAMEVVGDANGPWSSTRVRAAIAGGNFDEAEQVLGRPHSLAGVVVRGDQVGRTLGFPTANLAEVAEMIPPFGIYAVLVDRIGDGGEGGAALAWGVASIGVRPTVTSGFAIEAHLFDFSQDLYGARLRVHLVSYLRPERKFEGLPELRLQIGRDAEEARRRLAARGFGPAPAGPWF